jgi:ADP-ribose pyrophosphatase YjhB (NUDIX family)
MKVLRKRVPFVYRLQRKLRKDTMEKRTGSQLITQSSMYCNNCGEKGHIFRMCADPVLSCGIILVESPSIPVASDTTRLLMIRRKDSMSFAEFMRGKYDVKDVEYISRLFKNMTVKEQYLIISEPFDTIWKSLWGDDHQSSDYKMSYQKFYELNLQDLVYKNFSMYIEPEWGFPKGRRIRGESDIDCAIREFNEESNIPREAYTLLKNIRLEETFEGLNGVRYKHIYFVGLLQKPKIIDIFQRFTPMQRREISAIRWMTWSECEREIRPHHNQRQSMMNDLKSIIETFETV